MLTDFRTSSGQRVRWFVLAFARVAYRRWTRIAVRAFPYGSARARLAMRLRVPLPDRLNMSWITPCLAVGGRIRADDVRALAATGINSVVDTRIEDKDDESVLVGYGIDLLHLPTVDTTPLTLPQLHFGAEWINQQLRAGRKVLVHCEHGVGRSVMLATASLIARGLTTREALAVVQRQRWQAAPNAHQVRQLLAYERHLRESSPAQSVAPGIGRSKTGT